MTNNITENINISSFEKLVSPEEIKARLPLQEDTLQKVGNYRQIIRDILDRADHRLIVVIGPCSIHDIDAALDYAERLKKLSDEVSDTLVLVMRVYFEKPRTTVGWKGLINDPDLDDSCKIEEGLHKARRLLLKLSAMGLPTSTEALDPISPQYLHDIITWSAIGARTTESQTHREMSSGLSSPVGFKNGTDGGLQVAINALQTVAKPHSFLGVDPQGNVSIVHTAGNPYAHIVLRGGNSVRNYDSVSVAQCEQACSAAEVKNNIMIDCSHANSNKDHSLQTVVLDDVCKQIIDGNKSIIGLMMESNINSGRQDIPENLSQLKYGVSVTDACIDWETTEACIREARNKLKDVLPKRQA
ncbi:3-deoxy-7-phosphoheptulonate synthase [Haliea sp. AH-315-K21]|uniref:Phospho-2-dehydro-3-deoxyheptonate aldolase n=1 Tax=SAR86 cluster bacterium TaxID=2030880 RepID=A0A2A5CF26_9GAMM|nr:3-deoxy-7-phosphoheptulonate synthase [Haliea sp. AH-315-K21]MBN4075166.1 3-deoxy-7-phosphoheptulonate synthase [Gammaproteobacteria bacterium AH-315-E17]PCJ42118.1 MAG: 3-deoxy-7-phosphoheptulonate synthase [SAR86 cluster bacterium]